EPAEPGTAGARDGDAERRPAMRCGPRPPGRRVRGGPGSVAAGLAVGVLAAGCGSPAASGAHGHPAGKPGGAVGVSASAPGPPRATCGTSRTAADVPVLVEVEKGS